MKVTMIYHIYIYIVFIIIIKLKMSPGVEEIIVFNVIPVPIRPDLEGGILAAAGKCVRSIQQ